MFTLHGYSSKLLVLLGLCLLIGSIFSMLALFLAPMIFPISSVSDVLSNVSDPVNLQALKFLQLFNALGIFVIPPIVYVWLFTEKPLQSLSLQNTSKPALYALTLLLFLVSMPLLNWVVEWNSQIDLPDALSGIENWMRESEDRAMELTQALLQMDNISQLLVNLALIAVIPAVGEELLFRGLVQRFFSGWTKNHHLGIWISAILFSALHFQFFGFFPRMLLGALFGYMLYFTGSLWVPIFAHFINNATALIISYFYGFNTMESEVETLGTTDDTLLLLIPSVLFFITVFYYFVRKAKAECPLLTEDSSNMA